MTLLKEIISRKSLIYIFFILLHLFLLNINAAEWGDSYRILRSSEYLREGISYPVDEKRPPLYSIFLATHPDFVDPVVWGRILMFFVSVAFIFVFEKFLKLFIKSEKYLNIGLLLLILNPVFLYWSIRLYSDVLFSLLILLSFYLFLRYQKGRMHTKELIILGILSGLSVLTRFEGYLLFGSLGLGILFLDCAPSQNVNLKKIKKTHFLKVILGYFNFIVECFKKNFSLIFTYVVTFSFVVLPWLIYKNPLRSSYLDEPSGRSYGLTMIWTYVVSILFIFGFTSAFYFIAKDYKNINSILKSNFSVTIFISLELLLILVWPAAIPRLFVPIIPFFILFLVLSLQEHFSEDGKKESFFKLFVVSIVLLFLYIVSQYILKLQFLVPVKICFALILVLQVLTILFLCLKNFKWFVLSMLVSSFVWSASVIYIHKDNFISIKNAAEYVSKNISGVVVYNDVSSVSDWYLNQAPTRNPALSGYYYNFEKDELLTYDSLLSQNLDYLLITNEHNTTMEIDLKKRPYLTLVKEFSYNVNGKYFTSRVVKFNKDYKYE